MRSVEEWLKMYVHPTGVRLFAARETEKFARALGDAEVAAWAAEAVAADTLTQKLELEWLGKKDVDTNVRDRAMLVDNQVDSALGALYNHFLALRNRLPATNPQQQAAANLIKHVFPKGVRPITTMPFEQEHSAIDSILEQLTTHFAADITALGATIFFDHLVETQAEYTEVLSLLNSEPLVFNEVKVARERGKLLYAGLVLRILAKYFDDEDVRNKLLKTIEDQEARIGARNKRRYSHTSKKADGEGKDDENSDVDNDEFDDFADDFDENYQPVLEVPPSE